MPAEAMEGWEYVIEGFMDEGAVAIVSANGWTGYVDADDPVLPRALRHIRPARGIHSLVGAWCYADCRSEIQGDHQR